MKENSSPAVAAPIDPAAEVPPARKSGAALKLSVTRHLQSIRRWERLNEISAGARAGGLDPDFDEA